MEAFEKHLAQATTTDTGGVLGAIGLVVNHTGNILYHHAAGRQSLDADAPPLDPNSTIVLGSAGKFITHIAALQLVERGAVRLDEPVYKHLPELECLPLVSHGVGGEPFSLQPPTKQITLRHLLLHASGLSDDPLISAYAARVKPEFKDDAHPIVKRFSIPLIFEPGEGFAYGCSIHWTQLLVARIVGSFVGHIKEHIFDPLGMTSSSYMPRDREDIWSRRLRMVEREGDRLVHTDDASQGLACSMSDMGKIMADLISPSSKLLKQEHINLLFEGQFKASSSALTHLRRSPEEYAFCAGKPSTWGTTGPPSVNWSPAGLVVEDELPLSRMPKETVTWEGMPNVMWAMNREKGLAIFFATQLIPVGDEVANGLATTFMREAWTKFG